MFLRCIVSWSYLLWTGYTCPPYFYGARSLDRICLWTGYKCPPCFYGASCLDRICCEQVVRVLLVSAAHCVFIIFAVNRLYVSSMFLRRIVSWSYLLWTGDTCPSCFCGAWFLDHICCEQVIRGLCVSTKHCVLIIFAVNRLYVSSIKSLDHPMSLSKTNIATFKQLDS